MICGTSGRSPYYLADSMPRKAAPRKPPASGQASFCQGKKPGGIVGVPAVGAGPPPPSRPLASSGAQSGNNDP